MSELLSKVAEILKAPEELVQRSAEARAEASGKSVDEVLQSWAGGEAIESSAPAEAPTDEAKEEAPVEEVVEESPGEEVVEEAPVEEVIGPANVKTVVKKVAVINKTMDIKLNAETSLPGWLNLSFIVIPLFILIGMINTSNTQECGVNGILNVDRKSQQTVNCDGSPFEGRGVASSTINYVALGSRFTQVQLLVLVAMVQMVVVELVQHLLEENFIPHSYLFRSCKMDRTWFSRLAK